MLPIAMEEAMPVTDVVILSAIVAAFAVFALILAWAEYQTRHIRPIVRPAAAKADNDPSPTNASVKPTASGTQAGRRAA
jgi:hypothetical protein